MKAPFLFLAPFINSILGLRPSGVGDEVAATGLVGGLDRFLLEAQPWLTGWIPGLASQSDSAAEGQKIGLLVVIGVGVVLMTALGALSQFVFLQLSRGLSLRILADLRQDLAAHILRLGMGYHTSARKGDLLSRATTDVAVVLTALALLFDDLVLEPAQLLGNLLLAVVSMPELTLLVVLLVPLIVVPLLVFGKRVRKGSKKSLAALGESTEAMNQMFTGIRVVKAFRMEERELEEFREINHRWIHRAMSVVRAKALTEGSTHVLTHAGFALLLCGIGYAHLKLGMLQDVGSMGLWFFAFGTMYQHIRRISKAYQTVQESLGATERLFEVLDLEPNLRPERIGRRPIDAPIAEVELRDVVFSYGEETVLDGVSLRVAAGETVAIVGPSGAGKSTLVDLVARFHDPVAGSVRVNGIDLREIDPDAWFRCWALVDQHPFLFHASIKENVAYGRPAASDDDVREALRAANLLEFVEALPDGIHTEVGDRGARLSGGQRQRLTIARALLKNPPILLLDEATSSLDSESEAAVRLALDRLMAGRTSFVVAHRLSTIRNATRILVLDGGRVVQQGRHEDLLREDGLYRRLHEMQFGAGPQ